MDRTSSYNFFSSGPLPDRRWTLTNLKPIAGPAATIIRIDMLKATLYSIAIVTILVGSGCSLMETGIVGNSGSRVIAKSGDYIVLRVGTEDAHALAARYLGMKIAIGR